MSKESSAMKVLHVALRPGLGLFLAGAQFLSSTVENRTSAFTSSPYILSLGVVLIIASVALWVAASVHLQRAIEADKLATSGPFAYIRHPIYVSVYLLSAGLGFIFFTWLHFLVLVIFAPLWWIECKSEERAMQDKYGEKYISYQEHTSMFIPGIL